MFKDLGSVIKNNPYLSYFIKSDKITKKTKDTLMVYKINPNSVRVSYNNKKIIIKADTPVIKNQIYLNKKKIENLLGQEIIVN